MNMYYDKNVVDLSAMNEGALAEFYSANTDSHFWFQRAEVGVVLTYRTVMETSGHLWWKKRRRVAKLLMPNLTSGGEYNMLFDMTSRIGRLIESRVPIGYEIAVMAAPKFVRIECSGETYSQPVYDYNVVNVVDADCDRQLTMEEILDLCDKAKLRAPDFEVGQYMFQSLGEMFKSFSAFKNYVRECDDERYELIVFRATGELR